RRVLRPGRAADAGQGPHPAPPGRARQVPRRAPEVVRSDDRRHAGADAGLGRGLPARLGLQLGAGEERARLCAADARPGARGDRRLAPRERGVGGVSAVSGGSAERGPISAPAPGLSGGELLRKATHMAVGLIALALRFLGPLWSLVLAAVACL